jgi:hypothetical protein
MVRSGDADEIDRFILEQLAEILDVLRLAMVLADLLATVIAHLRVDIADGADLDVLEFAPFLDMLAAAAVAANHGTNQAFVRALARLHIVG